MVQEILFGLQNQASSNQHKIMDSEAIFQTLEANLRSSTQRASGEIGIS